MRYRKEFWLIILTIYLAIILSIAFKMIMEAV